MAGQFASMDDDIRDYVVEYASSSDQTYPFNEWVRSSISCQLMWLDEDELHVVVEVLKSYSHYDSLAEGDDITDASGDLGDVGSTFAAAVREGRGKDVALTLDRVGHNDQGVPAKFYHARI